MSSNRSSKNLRFASNNASNNRSALVEYEFGQFRVDPRHRRLWRCDKAIALAPKAFDLLLYLLDRRGQIVDKDDVIDAVWPNTAIQDGTLAQTVFVLRKALGQNSKSHDYIVTAPGRGYSFVADVRERPPAFAFNEDQGLQERSRIRWVRRRASWIYVALALASATLVLVFQVAQRGPASVTLPPPRAVPFTSYIGGQYEPAFSPDGRQVAFVWDGEKQDNYDIYVKPLEGGPPLRITTDAAGDGSPAWSPDGHSIAFIRYSDTPGLSGVYVIPSMGGPERKLVGLAPVGHLFDRHLDWSPDGKSLVFVDRDSDGEPFRLYTYSFGSGQRRVLTSPPSASVGDTGPSVSPDGHVVVFRRSTSSGVNDLYQIPMSGGETRRLTFDNNFTSSHTWTPDGHAIIVASRRSGSLMLWRLTMKDGRLTHLPDIGQDANFIALSRQGSRLAYSVWFANIDIWRMQIVHGREKFGNASPLILSALTDSSPQYSPDDLKIAFRSTRSGNFEIWVADEDGRNAVQLTSFRGPLTGTPRWSQDGRFIAFDSRPDGNGDIFVVGASGGSMRRITTNRTDDAVPSWSRDGKWIYFGSNRSGGWQVWKVPPGGESATVPAIQITHSGGFAAFESSDRKRVYYAKGPRVGGLWSVPVEGGEEAPVIPDLKPGYWGYWAVAENGIYFLDPIASGNCAVKLYSFSTGKTQQIGVMPKQPPYADSGLAVSRNGKSLLYPYVGHSGSNIMLVENFHP